MRRFVPLALSILVAAAYSKGDTPVVTQQKGKDAANSKITNKVNIDGPQEKVFDLVTSARYWKTWHPATFAVGGVTERPYLLDDVIHERVKFGAKDLLVTWKVVEHVRPKRIVLQALTHSARITYTFERQAKGIEFSRELQYDEAVLLKSIPDAKELRKVMHEQSELGLKQLKVLVEKTLHAEEAGF